MNRITVQLKRLSTHRLAAAFCAWFGLTVIALAHGAWLGTGVIDLTPATRTEIKARVLAGEPAVQNGDIIQVFSSFPTIVDGTLDGPGGYATMYVPEGTEVVGAFMTDAAGNELPARPAQATTGSGVSKGWGPKGQQAFDVSANGWNPESNTACLVAGFTVTTEDCNAGLAYIYGDTGIFYSSRSDTQLFANGSLVADLTNGYLVNPTNGTPWTTVGGSGTARVHNKWDAVQINAFGSGGTIDANGFSTSEETSITGGRGATPFRAGSPVAGPDSGSDWDRYGTTGPWQRIQYPGSCKADDPLIVGQEGPAVSAGSVYPETNNADVNSEFVCTDASATGFSLNGSDATQLPAATNAVRFAFGGIAQGEVYYASLRLRITDVDSLSPINAEGHGGDSAEGGAAGNDNPWRYWVAGSSVYAIPSGDDLAVGISISEVNGTTYTGGDIPPSATVRYRVGYANTSLSAMTNAVLSVTLPSQTTGTSNFEVISGEDILLVSDPSGGTFSFNTMANLEGLGSGVIEFDAKLSAAGGETVTADTALSSDQGGPATGSVSVAVSPSPTEEMPGCSGTRTPIVDWANDAPLTVGATTAFTNHGISGTVSTTDISTGLRTASIGTTNTLYPGIGGNPMLTARYVELRSTFATPLNGIYVYIADLNQNESATVYGLLDGVRVSPSMADGTGSFPMTRVANNDGSVTGERQNALGSGASRAVTVGFSQPIDTLVIEHTPLQFSAPGLSPSGSMEVSDILTCLDYSDAPSVLGDGLHNLRDSDDILLGSINSGDLAPGNAPNADSDDDDGVSIPPLTQGLTSTLTATVTGTSGYLQGWIDYNGNDVFESGTAEQIILDLQDDGTGSDQFANDGQIDIEIVVPGDAVLDQTFARFRWSSVQTLSPTGFAPDGEIEDYAVTIAAAPIVDRGDAPASYGDPQHIIADAGVAGTYLGAISPDPEAVSQASADATGDDLDGNDDEDGVAMPQLYVGATGEISVTVNEVTAGLGPIAYLQAWIDFDADGTFDEVDMIASNLQDGSAGDKDGLVNGVIVFDVNVPASATQLPTFARFRWSTTSGVVQLALDGEVEDYSLTLSGDSPPIVCDAGLYLIASGDSTLKRLNFSATPTGYALNLQDIGASGENLEGSWGYNELDGYIYGVPDGSSRLWRVDGAGAFTRMPDPTGGVEKGKTGGDVLPNGIMVYQSDRDVFQLLDITVPTASVNGGELLTSDEIRTEDFAYNEQDGFLYGIDENTGQVFKFSANGGSASVGTEQVTFFGPATYTGTYGAAWFDENGLFYVYDDATNNVYLVDTTTGISQRIATSSDEEGGGNDGASCRGPSVIPFGSVAGNIYVDQDGSDVKDGAEINLGGGVSVSIYDDRGTPNDLSDDNFIRTVETLADGTYTIGNLSGGSTYRIEVDEADTDLPAGSTIGTSNPLVSVSVVPNATTQDQNFGFDPGESDLSITKVAYKANTSTVITEATAGDLIDWVISVNNSGPGSPSNVTVIEKLPDGFEYLSDDAPATGDYFDPSTGVWFVDEILSGAVETLTIQVRVLETGTHINEVEIIRSSLPDSDSDVEVGSKTDDLSDGIADDDEDSYEITLKTGGPTLSGRVFNDNGTGGGTAHDGEFNGAESGAPASTLSILNDSGDTIAQPKIAADGTWSYALDGSYTGPLTLTVTPETGWMPVSENKSGLPTLVDASVYDGTYTFTPTAATDYADLDFGVIEEPRLTEDQTANIAAGQVVNLTHEYFATTTGDVTFIYGDNSQTPANGYSAGIFLDPDCDGTPDTALTGAIAVVDGDQICLVSRISAGAGVGPGGSFVYDLEARTALVNTPLSTVAINTDRITSGAGAGLISLRKTVRNETENTPESTANSGGVGDVLAYRIYVENVSPSAATDVIIFDRTPAYTSLSEPVSTPVSLGSSISCSLTVPAINVAGYAGPLRWDCAGSYPPSAAGFVAFKVQIDP
ncbi:DUF11 domain-containing protein [Neptunicoccus cionae]|uniref:DUF11 domain-containing protein n=1 Tax=Neptunicoccus cionae TaxID=2035344 RepID=A0A916QT63_9RHOB|nr:DUF11 domain-containing protein [Amylibacter cionae]GGA05689.1 hypothetical protein GCM10011498_01660 [Amylibacter cionae]